MANASEGRRTFLGRDSELTTLVGRAELALAGRGSISLILGESGSGKTTLARELTVRASNQGLHAVWSECRPDDSAPPLFPWIEIAGQLATIARDEVPVAIRQLLATRESPVVSGVHPLAEIDLARTFEQFLAFLRSLSRQGPFVVVLEDLHWADQPTLRLLEYLTGSMVRLPILIVVTTRPADSPGLTRTLGYLQREPSTRRIVLAGWTAPAISQFMTHETGSQPPAALVTAVLEATAGNPFFVSELTRAFASGEMKVGGPSSRLPASIRDAISARLDQLEPSTREVLTIAAVCGREFRAAAITGVASQPEQVGAELDAAVRAGLLLPDSMQFGVFSFAQAVVRDVVYANAPRERTRALHAALAAHLSVLPGAVTAEGVAELAYHYTRALPGGDPSAAVSAARRAGEFASRSFDAVTARNHFAAALNALDLAPEREAERGELLYLLGDAQTRSGNVRGGKETLAQAIQLASANDDGTLLARAALSYGEFQEAGIADPNRLTYLESALNMLSREDRYWVPVMSLLAEAEGMAGRVELALRHSNEALLAARESGEPLPLVIALNGRLWALRNSPDLEERSRLAEQMVNFSDGLRNREHAVKAHRWRLLAALESGDRSRFIQEMEAHARDSAVLREPVLLWRSACHQVVHAFLRGDFDEAERNYERALEAGNDVNSRGTAVLMALQRFALLKEVGRAGELAPQLLRMAASAPNNLTARITAAAAAHANGDFAGAREQVLAAWQIPRRASMVDAASMTMTMLLAEVAADVGDEPMVAALIAELTPHRLRNAVLGDGLMTLGPVSRVLGILHARLGNDRESIAAFEDAMSLAARMGAPAITARVMADYGEMLLAIAPRHADPQGLEMLQQSSDIARRTGMAALLERSERLLDEAATANPDLT